MINHNNKFSPINREAVGNLARLIENQIIEACDQSDLAHGEILLALMVAIGSVLASTNCRDCREMMAEGVQEMMPSFVGRALAVANSSIQ